MEKKKFVPLIVINAFFLIATIVTDVLYAKLGQPYLYKTLASTTFLVCTLANTILALCFKAKLNKNKNK